MTGSTPTHAIPYLTGSDKLELLDDWSQDLAEAMDTLITYVIDNAVAELTPALYSYQDHGNVSGPVTIDPTIGHHDLDATGPTTLTIDDAPDGLIVSISAVTGADQVTVDNVLDDVTLTADTIATFMHRRGDWRLVSSGTSGPADTTPPTPITDLAAMGGEGTLEATWTIPTDPDSTARTRYRYWETSEGASGTWATTTEAGFEATDVPAGDYTVEAYAYSAGGSSTADTATATVTAPEVHDFLDNFDGTAGTLLTAHVPDVGGGLWSKLGGAGTLELDGAGNAVIDNSNGSFTEYVQPDVVFTDGSISVDFTAGTGEPGWCVRNNGSGTRILVSQQGNALGLFPFVSGGLGSYLIKDAGLTAGLEVRVFLAVAGTVATVKVQRLSDGKWYDTDATAWVTPETTLITLTGVTANAGSPGFMFAQAGADGTEHRRFTADSA